MTQQAQNKTAASTATITLELPASDQAEGYSSTRIDGRLNATQARTAKRLLLALQREGATVEKHGSDMGVRSNADLFRVMLDRAAAGLADS